MSLDYNLTSIENLDALEPEVTRALIWMTMSVGMNRIDEKSIDEFTRRATIMERCTGPYLHHADDLGRPVAPRWITAKDIRDHLGMRTNATVHTKAQFKAKVWRRIEEKARGWSVQAENEQNMEGVKQ